MTNDTRSPGVAARSWSRRLVLSQLVHDLFRRAPAFPLLSSFGSQRNGGRASTHSRFLPRRDGTH